MQNKNALAALAYIKIKDNPFEVFCNFILYSLFVSSDNSLRLDQLYEKIENEFGLKLPIKMIETSASILIQAGSLETLPNGGGYKLTENSLDLDDFVSVRQELMAKEDSLLKDMSNYLTGLGVHWTEDEFRGNLSTFLFKHENALNLFLNNLVITQADNSSAVSPDWYISSYISNLIEKQDIYYQYLVEVVNGIMIYIGTYENSQDKVASDISGTTFFMDTKLLLRLLGFSWQAAVQSTKELVEIIQNHYDCNISYFSHTLVEVQNALYTAADNIRERGRIENIEIRAHRRNTHFDDNDYDIAAKSIKERLETEYNCLKYHDIDPNRMTVRNNYIDWEGLKKYISSEHKTWNEKAIENDVDSINYINILRRGKYDVKYGGENNLPIFVTTNVPFIKSVKDFIFSNKDKRRTANWNTKSLPVISETVLVSMLWLPISAQYSNMPALTLMRNTYSALQPNARFYEQFKKTITDVQRKHNYNILNISEERQNKLEQLVIKNTNGRIDNIDSDAVAYSVDELIRIESEGDKQTIDDLKTTLSERESVFSDLVEVYSKQILTGANMPQIYIWIGNNWWIINGVVFVAITSLISYCVSSVLLAGIAGVVSFITPYLFKVFDRGINHSKVANKIKLLANNKAKESCKKLVQKKLEKAGKPEMFNEVVKSCIAYIEKD